jgi:hypothetical protein
MYYFQKHTTICDPVGGCEHGLLNDHRSGELLDDRAGSREQQGHEPGSCWESLKAVIYDSQPTNRKPPYPAALRLAAWESHLTFRQSKYKKTTTNRWSSYFLIEKPPQTAFCEEYGRSRVKHIFTSGRFELYLLKVLGVIY